MKYLRSTYSCLKFELGCQNDVHNKTNTSEVIVMSAAEYTLPLKTNPAKLDAIGNVTREVCQHHSNESKNLIKTS